MGEMNRDELIAKIKKLFNLSKDNTNENEAIAAALKAQKLMADYDIVNSELHDLDERPIESIEARHAARKWRWQLAAIISQNFRCKFYQNRSWNGNAYDTHIVFYGYGSDAQAAVLTFNYLYKIGDRLSSARVSKARKEYGYAVGVYNCFVLGFVSGIQRELEKQSQALMLVLPTAVKESFEEMSASWRSANADLTISITAATHGVQIEGYEAGRDAIRARRVESSEERVQESRFALC